MSTGLVWSAPLVSAVAFALLFVAVIWPEMRLRRSYLTVVLVLDVAGGVLLAIRASVNHEEMTVYPIIAVLVFGGIFHGVWLRRAWTRKLRAVQPPVKLHDRAAG